MDVIAMETQRNNKLNKVSDREHCWLDSMGVFFIFLMTSNPMVMLLRDSFSFYLILSFCYY